MASPKTSDAPTARAGNADEADAAGAEPRDDGGRTGESEMGDEKGGEGEGARYLREADDPPNCPPHPGNSPEHADEGDVPDDALADDDGLPARPPRPEDFAPFFTLLHTRDSAGRTSRVHPTVHYLFADDDAEILVDACLFGLDGGVGQGEGRAGEGRVREMGGEGEGGVEGDVGGKRLYAPGERVVVVDLAADGRTVAGAKSLVAGWGVRRAGVGKAPSWDGGGAEGEGEGRMLGVEGFEVGDHGEGEGVGVGGFEGRGMEGLEELVRRFEEGLEGLEAVLGRVEGE